jgi:hypothetical protein
MADLGDRQTHMQQGGQTAPTSGAWRATLSLKSADPQTIDWTRPVIPKEVYAGWDISAGHKLEASWDKPFAA